MKFVKINALSMDRAADLRNQSAGSSSRNREASGSISSENGDEARKPNFSKEVRRLSVGGQLNHFEAMALVRKAMVTSCSGSRPNSARGHTQQLSHEENELFTDEESDIEEDEDEVNEDKEQSMEVEVNANAAKK